ncbi:hypothetical protein KAM448_36910 [Aeromonas caviae]|uniref:Type IV conjugative transfer system protein TraL n=1 Tax=Aeromonas caviae TaxID=648 RepID=A0ABD0B886_AERCA|nr:MULTISPECIES: hypothetical protein [Aeromonas]MBW3798969.1 hypothetical protein [Aeromonas hydrophila]MBW3803762.1 hypothetical protein [Aeromonas hydrophila]MBW3821775.1 hypothetical protein [Aeromonas hydrophila]BCK65882.1 hypothetical protein KAM330_48710 [Aeromonas hydrophila]BCR31473.1 hypothetical protein KAM376_44790 [Aeromonas caviae]
MNYNGHLYKYAHLPLQVVWFSTEEWMIILMAYIAALGFEGIAYVISPALAFAALAYKKDKPRGFFIHAQYQIGFKRLQGYPTAQARVFFE